MPGTVFARFFAVCCLKPSDNPILQHTLDLGRVASHLQKQDKIISLITYLKISPRFILGGGQGGAESFSISCMLATPYLITNTGQERTVRAALKSSPETRVLVWLYESDCVSCLW